MRPNFIPKSQSTESCLYPIEHIVSTEQIKNIDNNVNNKRLPN